jgi:hypothetical protein
MPRPICFMIMPYGTKPTQGPEGSAAPDRIDFDRLWKAAFLPAIGDMGYEAVRADQDLGAAIIKEMVERLAISDLVIADVTSPNANAYYEVGVRHAAKQTGCVMIAADWAQPLFDINQMRQVRYPLPAESVDDATAERIREILKESVPKLAHGQSPVYEFLPGYPDKLDPKRASAFRKTLEELASFQAEVHAARSLPQPYSTQKALELRDRFYAGGPVQFAVALELLYLLRECTDWKTTREYIERLPDEIKTTTVVKEQHALAQSKDGDHHAAIGALRELISLSGDTSERRGLLGGRYKKLWSTEQDAARKAQYLDKAIYEYDAGMKLDLNDYYPSSNLPRLYRLRARRGDDAKARVAASVTSVACDRARARGATDPWLKPTLLGAAFDAGDSARAAELADDIRAEGAAAWQLETTLDDLRRAVTFHQGETADELTAIVKNLEQYLR